MRTSLYTYRLLRTSDLAFTPLLFHMHSTLCAYICANLILPAHLFVLDTMQLLLHLLYYAYCITRNVYCTLCFACTLLCTHFALYTLFCMYFAPCFVYCTLCAWLCGFIWCTLFCTFCTYYVLRTLYYTLCPMPISSRQVPQSCTLLLIQLVSYSFLHRYCQDQLY